MSQTEIGTVVRSHSGLWSLLNGADVLITGSTGFVGKVIVEKLVRCGFCSVIYVLIRPKKGKTTIQRLEEEIFSSEIFNRLRQDLNLDKRQLFKFLHSRIVGIPGDITHKNCGISTQDLSKLSLNVRVVYHCAASVTFADRIDRAVDLNVHGALRMFELALSLSSVQSFVHVSTAYVNSNRDESLPIKEKLYPLGFEPDQVLEKVSQMNLQELQKAPISGLMKDWPNSYTFTKAIAEHLLRRRHLASERQISLAIIRPSIITAAWKEPVPGWIDTINAAAAVYAGVALGAIKFLPGSYSRILDIVPVDIAANTILLAASAAIQCKENFLIAHCCSSFIHPMRFRGVIEPSIDYGQRNPPSAGSDKPSFFFASPNMFEILFYLRYTLPSTLFSAVSEFGTKKLQRKALQFDRLVFKLRSTVRSFRFFLDNGWIFVSENAVAIVDQNSNLDEKAIFPFNIEKLQWEVYSPVFAYGMIKYVLEDDLIEIDRKHFDNPKALLNDPFPINLPNAPKPFERLSLPKEIFRKLMPDTFLMLERASKVPKFSVAPIKDIKRSVMSSRKVRNMLEEESKRRKSPLLHVQVQAEGILDKMMGEPTYEAITSLGVMFRKIFKILFDNVYVNLKGMDVIRAAAKKGSVIYMPTHRSYIDFLIVSYVCFFYDIPLPYIAAGEDFLGIAVVNHFLRYSGAFFMRRSFVNDPVYTALFSEYVHQLLLRNAALEFFIEGTRSRSGKMLHPKFGFLSFVLDSFFDRENAKVTLCPITINFEKTVEGELYRNELEGDGKIKESLSSLISSIPALLSSLGRISINFDENVIDIGEFVSLQPPSCRNSKSLVKSLSYTITDRLSQNLECMATHLIASLFLMYRQGINYDQLIEQVQFLRHEVMKRGGNVAFMEMESIQNVVKRALYHLRFLIVERRNNFFEPVASHRNDCRNMLLLGHYRNKIFHLFFVESVWACAFSAMDKNSIHEGIDKQNLVQEACFLYKVLCREIVKPDAHEWDFASTFQVMIRNNVFLENESGLISIPHEGEMLFSFLCSICWPFIDSYFVVALSLFALQSLKEISPSKFISRAQWLANTLYHESVICFYESCSTDTLGNALNYFLSLGILQKGKTTDKGSVLRLTEDFQCDVKLQNLVDRIGSLRKAPLVNKPINRKSLIADIPMLARL